MIVVKKFKSVLICFLLLLIITGCSLTDEETSFHFDLSNQSSYNFIVTYSTCEFDSTRYLEANSFIHLFDDFENGKIELSDNDFSSYIDSIYIDVNDSLQYIQHPTDENLWQHFHSIDSSFGLNINTHTYTLIIVDSLLIEK